MFCKSSFFYLNLYLYQYYYQSIINEHVAQAYKMAEMTRLIIVEQQQLSKLADIDFNFKKLKDISFSFY